MTFTPQQFDALADWIRREAVLAAGERTFANQHGIDAVAKKAIKAKALAYTLLVEVT